MALGLSWLFSLGTLVLLWATFVGRRLEAGAAVVLLYAAFAPGMIFGYAVYPLSMLAFFTVAYLWLVSRERWLAAGLTGCVLVLAYPVGIATPAAVALYVLIAYRASPPGERLRRAGLAVGPPIASIGLLLLHLQLSVGHWNGYFLIQEKYHHHLREPFAPVVHAVGTLAGSSSFPLSRVSALQALLVAAALVCALAAVVRRRRSPLPGDLLLALWAFTAWVVPASTSHLAGQRGDTALVPLAILVGRLPRRLAVVLVVAAVAVTTPMEVLYLRGALA